MSNPSVPTESRPIAEKCPSCQAIDNNPYTDANGVSMRACGRCMIQWRAASSSLLPVGRQLENGIFIPLKLKEKLWEFLNRRMERDRWQDEQGQLRQGLEDCADPTRKVAAFYCGMCHGSGKDFNSAGEYRGPCFCVKPAKDHPDSFAYKLASLPVGESTPEKFDWKHAYRKIALFLHRRDRHNQFIERCEYYRCNPDGAPHITLAEVEQLRNEGEYCPSALPAEKETELGLGESREPLPQPIIMKGVMCGHPDCPCTGGYLHDLKDLLPSVPAEIESSTPPKLP